MATSSSAGALQHPSGVNERPCWLPAPGVSSANAAQLLEGDDGT